MDTFKLNEQEFIKIVDLSAHAFKLYCIIKKNCLDSNNRCVKLTWRKLAASIMSKNSIDDVTRQKVRSILAVLEQKGLITNLGKGTFQCNALLPEDTQQQNLTIFDEVKLEDISTNLALTQCELPTFNAGQFLDNLFTEFWALYPKNHGKAAAKKIFSKIVKDEGYDVARSIIDGVRMYIPVYASREKKFIPDAERWLKKRRWEDSFPDQEDKSKNAEDLWNIPN